MIRQPSQLTLLDVGGDDVGATVLATLEDELKEKSLRVLQVINPLRPFTETVEGCLKTIVFIVGWSVLFYLWVFVFGLPVGPGAATYYTP